MVLGGIFLHATSSGALLRPISRNKGFNKHGYSTLHSRVKLTQDDKSDSVQGGGNSGTDSRCGCFSYCLASLHESLDLSLFKEPLFYIIVIVSCTIRFTHTAWVIYIVPRAVDTGVPLLRASLVATVGGVGDAVGKILPGILKWKKFANTKTIWICGMSIMTFSLILSAFVPTFGAMLALAFFQGLGLGMSYSLLNVVYKEMFGTERMVNFMGWLRCFSGVGRVLGGFVPGKCSFIPISLSFVLMLSSK